MIGKIKFKKDYYVKTPKNKLGCGFSFFGEEWQEAELMVILLKETIAFALIPSLLRKDQINRNIFQNK